MKPWQETTGTQATVGDYLAYVQRYREQASSYGKAQAAKYRRPKPSEVRRVPITPELERKALEALRQAGAGDELPRSVHRGR